MKRNLLIILLLISMLLISCDDDLDVNVFDNNEGVIFSPLTEDHITMVKRDIYLEKENKQFNTLTDTFSVKGEGKFYYPVLVDGLDDEFFKSLDTYDCDVLFKGRVGAKLASVKEKINEFDFKIDDVVKDRALTIYEIKVHKFSEDMKGTAPDIAVFIPPSYEENIYTYGFNGFTRKDEKLVYHFSVPRKSFLIQTKYYIITDKDLKEGFDIKTYENGALLKETNDADYEVIKFETTLYQLIKNLYKESIIEGREPLYHREDDLFTILDSTMNAFDEKNPSKNGMNNLMDLIHNDLYKKRIIYLEFDVNEKKSDFSVKRKIVPSSNHYRKSGKRNFLKEYVIFNSYPNSTVHIKGDFVLKAIYEGLEELEIESDFLLKKDVDYRIDFEEKH